LNGDYGIIETLYKEEIEELNSKYDLMKSNALHKLKTKITESIRLQSIPIISNFLKSFGIRLKQVKQSKSGVRYYALDTTVLNLIQKK
jgi:hypothetical protein